MKKRRRYWTAAEDRKLRRLWPHKQDEDCAKAIGRTVPGCANRAHILGLRKTKAFIRNHSKRFSRGFTPWNAGLKGVNGFSSTRWKKGNTPQTWQPLGTERLKDGVLYRKVADVRDRRKDWKAVSVIVWESVHGPLPRGKVVVFADRDQSNFAPENLLAVTRAENMKRNSYLRFPQPIPKLIQLKGALQRQINRRGSEKHRHA